MTGQVRIDNLIAQTIEGYGNKWFDKEHAALRALAPLRPIPKMKGVNLEAILLDYIKRRMDAVKLHRLDKFGNRFYENYATGEGYRWQKFTGMNLKELRVCIAYRERQLHGHEQVLKVYRALETDLAQLGERSQIRHVYNHESGPLGEAGKSVVTGEVVVVPETAGASPGYLA
jgi:heme oxygenase